MSASRGGPHCWYAVAVEKGLCIVSIGFRLLASLEPVALSLGELVKSFPSNVDAISCIDDHDPQRPEPEVVGDVDVPPNPKLDEDLLLDCTLFDTLVVDVERDGWAEGRGDAALESKNDEAVDSGSADEKSGPLSSRVSNSSSTEMSRRLRGRRVAEVLVPCCRGFMALNDTPGASLTL